MENIIFYFLFVFIILNSLLIILSKNPVHSILFLVLVFISVTVFLLFIGVEFIAMLFLVIYVGAIIVLFLFVIMMLNIKIIEFNERLLMYLPIGIFLGIIFILEIFYLVNVNFCIWFLDHNQNYIFNVKENLFNSYFPIYENYVNILIEDFTNMKQLAINLYIKFVYFFFLNGVILLIAMIGAITLTLNRKFSTKRQDIYAQVTRSLEDSVRYLTYNK